MDMSVSIPWALTFLLVAGAISIWLLAMPPAGKTVTRYSDRATRYGAATSCVLSVLGLVLVCLSLAIIWVRYD